MNRVLSLAFGILMAAGLAGAQDKGPQPGAEVPTFSVPYLNKTGKVNLKAFFHNTVPDSDKVVVLSFFSSTCKPCRHELPHIQEIYGKYQDQGLVVLAVFSEKQVDTVKWAKDWFAENKLTYGLVHDEYGIVKKRFEIEAYPTNYVVNREGLIVKKFVGYDSTVAKDFDQLIEQLMRPDTESK